MSHKSSNSARVDSDTKSEIESKFAERLSRSQGGIVKTIRNDQDIFVVERNPTYHKHKAIK